jgi:hypothetical protein
LPGSAPGAQASYQGANGGFYDAPGCLVHPQRCIPGYQPGEPAFLDSLFMQDVRYGYRWTFHAGRAAPADTLRAGGVSPSSLTSWAYVGVPVDARAGARGFCGDATGIVCMTIDGLTPPVAAGACVTGGPCRVMR